MSQIFTEPLNPVPGPLEAPPIRRWLLLPSVSRSGTFYVALYPHSWKHHIFSFPRSTWTDTWLKEETLQEFVHCVLTRYKKACRICSSVPVKQGQTVSKWPEGYQAPPYKLDLWRGPSRSYR